MNLKKNVTKAEILWIVLAFFITGLLLLLGYKVFPQTMFGQFCQSEFGAIIVLFVIAEICHIGYKMTRGRTNEANE